MKETHAEEPTATLIDKHRDPIPEFQAERFNALFITRSLSECRRQPNIYGGLSQRIWRRFRRRLWRRIWHWLIVEGYGYRGGYGGGYGYRMGVGGYGGYGSMNQTSCPAPIPWETQPLSPYLNMLRRGISHFFYGVRPAHARNGRPLLDGSPVHGLWREPNDVLSPPRHGGPESDRGHNRS